MARAGKKTSKKNAVERRVERLRDEFRAFLALPSARLLCFRVNQDEAPLVDALVAMEGDEQEGEVPALLLRFDVPFTDPATYGLALREAFVAEYEGSRGDLAAEGFGATWTCPVAAGLPSSLDALVQCGASFTDHYADLCEHLVLVLVPAQISDVAAFQVWLEVAARRAVATSVRFITIDDRDSPALRTLGARDSDLIRVVALDLEMPSVFEEISADLGLLGDSRDVRSSAFLRISAALKRDDLPEAESIAARAVQAAEKGDAPQEAAVIHFSLGSALLAKGRAPDAILRYGQADAAASRAERQGESSSSKLRLITRLALGAALVYAGAFEKAAEVYQTAAPLAASQSDLFMQVESWRMAGYAHERAGAHHLAWAAGMEALRVGAQMSKEERASSTLAYAGEGLLRVAQGGAGNTKVVHERMTALLGSSWRAEAKVTRQIS